MEKLFAVKIFAKNFLGTTDKNIIDELVNISKITTLEKKENLFFEGSPASHIYYIISGGIKLYRLSQDGKEVIIRLASKNDIFAEAAIARLEKYPVNASSTHKSVLLAISVEKLRKLTTSKPEYMLQLIDAMTAQLKYLVDTISSLTYDNTEERLIKYLKNLSEKTKNNTVELPIQKGELALLLGTTPETISRLFNKLTKNNIIKKENKKITLLTY